MNRSLRNSLAFLGGFLLISMIAIVPEVQAAPADPVTSSQFDAAVAETQQILTGIAHSLAWCLGVVAGRFR